MNVIFYVGCHTEPAIRHGWNAYYEVLCVILLLLEYFYVFNTIGQHWSPRIDHNQERARRGRRQLPSTSAVRLTRRRPIEEAARREGVRQSTSERSDADRARPVRPMEESDSRASGVWSLRRSGSH